MICALSVSTMSSSSYLSGSLPATVSYCSFISAGSSIISLNRLLLIIDPKEDADVPPIMVPIMLLGFTSIRSPFTSYAYTLGVTGYVYLTVLTSFSISEYVFSRCSLKALRSLVPIP